MAKKNVLFSCNEIKNRINLKLSKNIPWRTVKNIIEIYNIPYKFAASNERIKLYNDKDLEFIEKVYTSGEYLTYNRADNEYNQKLLSALKETIKEFNRLLGDYK